MSLQLKQSALPADEKSLSEFKHIVLVLPASRPQSLPFSDLLDARLKRSNTKYSDLAKTPITFDLPEGAMASWVVLEDKVATFKRHTQLR
ncbi:MAG TPA: leucyl aminopeptidase family protein, partial [Methyloradius sp.]|nr:leucyl aminopeptidase family protein [Methyloradius sp.]